MTNAILSIEDHAARAAYHQAWAAGYAEQQELDRERGDLFGAVLCQRNAELQAARARFHLFRAIDMQAEA